MTPCTGMMTAMGIAEAITAKSATPPPRPTAAVMAEVRKETSTSVRENAGERSGGIRAAS